MKNTIETRIGYGRFISKWGGNLNADGTEFKEIQSDLSDVRELYLERNLTLKNLLKKWIKNIKA